MFLAYPQNVYSLGHRYTHPEPEDVYGSRSYRHYPSVTGLDYQRTGAHAARAQYFNALEQAHQAELEYLESIHRPHSSHLLYGDAYTISSSPSYSYYDREAAALERERALNAQLVERRLAQLARQQEEERLRRALEERRCGAAVAQELRRAQEAAIEERRRLEEIRIRSERLKQRELLERRRQQQQLLKQSLMLKSAPPCSATFGCPVPTSSSVVPIADTFNFLFDVLHPVVTGQDNTSRAAVPAPVAPSPPAPVTQQKKESKPEPRSQPRTGTTSRAPYPQQALFDLSGLKGDSEIKQVLDNVFGLFDPTATRPAQPSSSPITPPSSGSSSTSETKQVPKAQPSAQETLKQHLDAEQDIDFRHVIENVLGLFNPDFVRPTSSTTSRPTPPPCPASSSSDKGKAKEIIPSTEPREPTSKDVLDSFNTIENIAASFSALEHDFEFPLQLDFTDASAQSVLQQLTFTARNAPLRFYEQSLTGLLGQLDAVESYGNEEVRHRRKEVVERIEKALEEIEREVEHRARAWRVKRNPVTTVKDVAPSQNAIAKEVASSSGGSPSAAPQEPSLNSVTESTDAVAQSDALQGTSLASASELQLPNPLEAVTVTDSANEIALTTKEEQLLAPKELSATPSAELGQPSTSQPEPKEPTQSIIVDESQIAPTHELTEELLSQADPVSESVSTITPFSPAPTFAQLAPTHVLTDTAIESSSEETPDSSPAVVPEHKSGSTSLGEASSTSSLLDTTVVSDSESEQDSFLLAAPVSESSSLASSKRRPPSVTVEEVPDSDWSEVDA